MAIMLSTSAKGNVYDENRKSLKLAIVRDYERHTR